MYDDNQILIPESFMALFMVPSRSKPTEPYATVLARYELCEDMANMLVDHATTKMWELGVEKQDVVQRIHQGLAGGEAGVSDAEAQWVLLRLSELLGNT
jgi:hypothetical protein